MRTLAKTRREPGIWMTEAEKPAVGHNDVRIRVRKTAICGTDMHIFNWDEWSQKTIPVPMTVGHEYVGVIEAMGEEVRGLKIGQRVSGEGHIVCGHCRNCRAGRRHLCRNTQGVGVNRPGAFADYLVIPAENAFPIPDDISDEIASILDPFGNAAHTALSFDLVGEDVLITGAGPIGIMAAAICRHAGARHIVITDMNDYRLALATKMGARDVRDLVQDDRDAAVGPRPNANDHAPLRGGRVSQWIRRDELGAVGQSGAELGMKRGRWRGPSMNSRGRGERIRTFDPLHPMQQQILY